jgi:hypothetical protein
MPVGTLSGEIEYVMGIQVHRFWWVAPVRSCILDKRCHDIPAWMCGSMPHYFKAVKGKSSNKKRTGVLSGDAGVETL